MNGTELHIAQNFPNAVYSEVYFFQSKNGVVNKVFDNEGAIAIYIHNIYIVSNNTGAQLDFVDVNNIPVLSTIDVPTTYYPVHYVRKGQVLNMKVNVPGILFTVSFQYLLDPFIDKKK